MTPEEIEKIAKQISEIVLKNIIKYFDNSIRVHDVMTNDERNLDFEYDVFLYQPEFDSIIERIQDLNDSQAIVYVSDIETYLPEYEVNEYIEQHTDDE